MILRAQKILRLQKALELITNTADRICNIVSIKGDAGSPETNADVKAQLDGLLSKLADIGTSSIWGINNETYQNILQQDLSATLKDNAACKLKVFNSLLGKLLEPATAPPVPVLQPPPSSRAPASPSAAIIPSPGPSNGASAAAHPDRPYKYRQVRRLLAGRAHAGLGQRGPDGQALGRGQRTRAAHLQWTFGLCLVRRVFAGRARRGVGQRGPDGQALGRGKRRALRTLRGHSIRSGPSRFRRTGNVASASDATRSSSGMWRAGASCAHSADIRSRSSPSRFRRTGGCWLGER